MKPDEVLLIGLHIAEGLTPRGNTSRRALNPDAVKWLIDKNSSRAMRRVCAHVRGRVLANRIALGLLSGTRERNRGVTASITAASFCRTSMIAVHARSTPFSENGKSPSGPAKPSPFSMRLRREPARPAIAVRAGGQRATAS